MTTTKGSLVANLLRTVPVLLQSTHEPTLEGACALLGVKPRSLTPQEQRHIKIVIQRHEQHVLPRWVKAKPCLQDTDLDEREPYNFTFAAEKATSGLSDASFLAFREFEYRVYCSVPEAQQPVALAWMQTDEGHLDMCRLYHRLVVARPAHSGWSGGQEHVQAHVPPVAPGLQPAVTAAGVGAAAGAGAPMARHGVGRVHKVSPPTFSLPPRARDAPTLEARRKLSPSKAVTPDVPPGAVGNGGHRSQVVPVPGHDASLPPGREAQGSAGVSLTPGPSARPHAAAVSQPLSQPLSQPPSQTRVSFGPSPNRVEGARAKARLARRAEAARLSQGITDADLTSETSTETGEEERGSGSSQGTDSLAACDDVERPAKRPRASGGNEVSAGAHKAAPATHAEAPGAGQHAGVERHAGAGHAGVERHAVAGQPSASVAGTAAGVGQGGGSGMRGGGEGSGERATPAGLATETVAGAGAKGTGANAGQEMERWAEAERVRGHGVAGAGLVERIKVAAPGQMAQGGAAASGQAVGGAPATGQMAQGRAPASGPAVQGGAPASGQAVGGAPASGPAVQGGVWPGGVRPGSNPGMPAESVAQWVARELQGYDPSIAALVYTVHELRSQLLAERAALAHSHTQLACLARNHVVLQETCGTLTRAVQVQAKALQEAQAALQAFERSRGNINLVVDHQTMHLQELLRKYAPLQQQQQQQQQQIQQQQ